MTSFRATAHTLLLASVVTGVVGVSLTASKGQAGDTSRVLAASDRQAAARCAALVGTPLMSGRVDQATYVPAGSHIAANVLQPADASGSAEAAAPRAPLPAFCRVQGTATPTPRSRIGFEVWLPATSWNSRVHMVGNGGYSSEIRLTLLGNILRSGAVAVATDTGHQSDDKLLGDLQFGINNPDAIGDWGHRAVHESIDAGKRLIKAYYGRAASHAYFSGCSTGGHQALMEAQRYPTDFDGIIAGDPGNNRTNLNLAFMWLFLQNHEPGDNKSPILNRNALLTVNRAVIAQCDKLDGVVDGVVTDPRQCHFNPAVTLCKPGQTSECLTPRQVRAVQAVYDGPRRRGSGEVLYPGWAAGSEFVTGQGASMGWDLYWANLKKPEEPQRVDYFRYWAFNDPSWNWWNFDWDKDVDRARATLGPEIDAVSPDLTAFRKRGGRLIMFSGWQDPVVSPYDTIGYYRQVMKRYGGAAQTQSFARLFMVPGMEHCAGGPGATNFASSVRDSTPLQPDADHDISLAIEKWVETGVAPTAVIAAKYANRGEPPAPVPDKGPISLVPTISDDPQKRMVVFTRKLCPYPAVGTYSGRGDTKVAANYICSVPRS